MYLFFKKKTVLNYMNGPNNQEKMRTDRCANGKKTNLL